MESEITAALIGVIVGGLTNSLTTRLGYKELYAKNISSNRMEWINNFREEVSIIVATIKMLPIKDSKDNKEDKSLFNAEKARAKLLTRLNMNKSKSGNEYNQVMADVLNAIDFSKPYSYNSKYSETIIELSRKILEPEWKRVKREAGGDKK